MLIVYILFICLYILTFYWASPNGLAVKNLPAKAGDANLILGSGRSPGEGNGNPLQYSYLENLMDREEPERATVHGVTKESDGTKHSTAHSFVKKNFSLSHICLLSVWTQKIDSYVTESEKWQ